MEDVLDVIVGALKGLGKEKAAAFGRDLRATINAKVQGSNPTYDDGLLEVADAFIEGLGDDSALPASAPQPE